MAKMGKVATKNSGSHTREKRKKSRKKDVHITLDEEVSAVMDELALNNSEFINRVLRAIFLEKRWVKCP